MPPNDTALGPKAEKTDVEFMGVNESKDEHHRTLGDPDAKGTLCNDLQAAIDVNVGQGWCTLYPNNRLRFHAGLVQVRLRDDHDIQGQSSLEAANWDLSAGFGPFCSQVAGFLEQEARSTEREEQLRKQRLKVIDEKQWEIIERSRATSTVGFVGCCVAPLALLLVCTVIPPENELASLLLSFAVFVLFGIFCLCQAMMMLHRHNMTSAMQFKKEKKQVVRTFVFSCLNCCEWAFFVHTLLGVLCFVLICFVTMSVLHCTKGFWWTPLIVFSSIPVSLFCLCLLYYICPGFWNPLRKNPQHWETVKKEACDRTIVFEGGVLPGRLPCVCSWPGKYESAWDALVQSSRSHTVSAAVVFLPAGSRDFGRHDRIPRKHGPLPGKCWCFPLYGERKPWGCRWWTLWIANIEKAVHQGAELQVFYFKNLKGQGHVQHFTTAGQEHLRREMLNQRQEEFKMSPEFGMVRDQVEGLCHSKGADSSSQYTREVQRLFLEWLPAEDRDFLQASEGLGNSQKAEVAWLEMKGYHYTQVEVNADQWLSDLPAFDGDDQC